MKAWWQAPESKVFESVTDLVKAIGDAQVQHQQDTLKSFRLYGNFESRGMMAGNYFRPNSGKNNRLTLNVIKSCADTVVARIAKTQPRPTFLTSGGSWSQQKKAKLLDKFTAGIFHQTKFGKTAGKCFRDAVVFGKGGVKILEDARGRIRIERVFPDEIIVDDMEAVDGEPRQIHQRRIISREVLRGMFDDNAAAQEMIDKAKPAKLGSESTRQVEAADLLIVIESWHLPSMLAPELTEEDNALDKSSPEYSAALMRGHDGRHAMTIENGTLLFEAWRDDYFPFVFIDWTPALRGFWPTGLPMELVGIQYEINKILRKIQESIDWCVPKAFVEHHSKVVLAHLNDIAGGVIRYTGQMPVIQALSTISPELLAQVDRLVRQAYEISGVSQLSAQSKKPAGLESGASLREYHDIETERFAMVAKAYEDFFIEVSLMAIRLARKIADRDGDYAVTAPSRRKAILKIKWKEIDLDDSDFVMQVFPSSSLPHTPAGRLAMVQDLVNLGFLDKEDVLRLLDFPDLEAVNALNEASAEFTSMQIENMVEKGKPQSPQPFQNLAYALKHAQSAYLLASTCDDVDEGNLEFLSEYMQECVALMKAAMPQQQQAPPPGAEPGVPAGPPTMPAPGMPQVAPAGVPLQ